MLLSTATFAVDVLAQSEDVSKATLDAGTNSTWYDSEKQSWVYPSGQWTATGESSLDARHRATVTPKELSFDFGKWLGDTLAGLASFFRDVFSSIRNLLFAILIILLTTLFVYVVVAVIKGSSNPFAWRRSKSNQSTKPQFDPAKIVDLPFAVDSPTGDLLGQAEEFRRNGDYARSIIFLYGHLLVELDANGLIHLQRGKTNRMYLREMRKAQEPLKYLQYFVQVFEAVFFGRYPIDKEQCERAWKLLPKFNQAVEETAAAQHAGELLSTNAALTASTSLNDISMGASTGGLILLLVSSIGCSTSIFPAEKYGESKGSKSRSALGGFGLFAAICSESGYRTFQSTAFSSRAQKLDTIVWAPKDYRMPTEKELNWLNDWLEAGSNRTLIYVGRDYSPSESYWKNGAETLAPESRADCRVRQALAKNQLDRLFDKHEQIESPWFRLEEKQPFTRRITAFQGPWAKLIQNESTHVVVHRVLSPMLTAWKQNIPKPIDEVYSPWEESTETAKIETVNRGRPTVNTLLKSDKGEPLISRIRFSHWGESQVLVFANGSFLMNEGLTFPGNRKLAFEILNDQPTKARVGFISTEGEVPVGNSDDSEGASGFELLRVWPLSLISMHGLILGFVAMLALWPIFGRPQKLPSTSTTDFGKHIEALGDLLYLSKDRSFALEKIAEYFREVRNDAASDWSKHRVEPNSLPTPVQKIVHKVANPFADKSNIAPSHETETKPS
jgi:hypothetical protein